MLNRQKELNEIWRRYGRRAGFCFPSFFYFSFLSKSYFLRSAGRTRRSSVSNIFREVDKSSTNCWTRIEWKQMGPTVTWAHLHGQLYRLVLLLSFVSLFAPPFDGGFDLALLSIRWIPFYLLDLFYPVYSLCLSVCAWVWMATTSATEMAIVDQIIGQCLNNPHGPAWRTCCASVAPIDRPTDRILKSHSHRLVVDRLKLK